MPVLHSDVSVFANLEKVSRQPDGTLMIEATVSTERVDDQGERVTYEALKKAAPDFMEWGGVNEMHLPSIAGTTVELRLDDTLRKATATLHVVDPIAVKKVDAGVYKGVSLEGRKLARQMSKVGGRNVWDITDIQWNRISLVDRPSNPDARLTLAKAAGIEEEAPVDEPTATPAEGTAELAKATEVTAEPPNTAEQESSAVVPELLVKAARDDTSRATYALTTVNDLIIAESAEPTLDPGQVALLRTAQTALVAFIGAEAAEVGTPADVAAEAADKAARSVTVEVMEYAEPIGDLRKAILELKGLVAAWPDSLAKMTTPGEALTLEASESPDFGALLKVALSDDDTLAKVAAVVSDRIGADTSKALEAMKVELIEGFKPSQDLLAKVAAMAAPGGPVRYAERGGQRIGLVGDDDPDAESSADVLMKAAGMMATRDPGTAASLRQAAAAEQVGQIRNSR